MLLDKPYGFEVDWWAFGVILYQMIFQLSPFRGEDEDEIYDAILSEMSPYPSHSSPSAELLIGRLLTREPTQRLGYDGAKEIMNHEFFKSIDWEALRTKAVKPPFLPKIESQEDVSNFDPEFTKASPSLTPSQSGMFDSLL